MTCPTCGTAAGVMIERPYCSQACRRNAVAAVPVGLSPELHVPTQLRVCRHPHGAWALALDWSSTYRCPDCPQVVYLAPGVPIPNAIAPWVIPSS